MPRACCGSAAASRATAAVTVSALGGDGVPYMAGICALTDQLARPWQAHPAYGDGPRLAAAGAAWCRRYPDFEHAAAG